MDLTDLMIEADIKVKKVIDIRLTICLLHDSITHSKLGNENMCFDCIKRAKLILEKLLDE